MALITRDANAGVDASTASMAAQITGLYAGEDLDAAAPCYIHTDGKAYMCDATAADAKAVMAGFTPRAAKSGQPITLYGIGTRLRYGSGLTPGAKLYLGATKGRLDSAATTGDSVGVAQVISGTDIRVTVNITPTDTTGGD